MSFSVEVRLRIYSDLDNLHNTMASILIANHHILGTGEENGIHLQPVACHTVQMFYSQPQCHGVFLFQS